MSSQGKNEESENRPNPPQSITVGDVTNSIGVAIGDGASSTVIVHNHYAATRKRPDYLNLAPKIDYFLERPTQYDALKTLLINPNQDAVAISATALRGAGGFGKTTLAQALCYDLDIQNNFSDGILWVELGEKPDNIPGKINDLIYHLTDINPGFVDQNNAAAELENALAGKKCLLVIDDLWNPVHATPFLRGGSTTTHLITTRNVSTLPRGTQAVDVESLDNAEAIAMLVRDLTDWQLFTNQLNFLASRLGRWPLLLKLTNSTLYRRANQQGLEIALAYVDKALDKRGLIAFDAKNIDDRHQAVAATLGVSLDELDDDEQHRFRELAVFPEDTDVPLAAVTTLWGATGNLDDFDTEELCTILYDRSLLLRYDDQSLRFHDVIRQFLLDEWDESVESLHQQLLDAYNPTADWPNGPNDGYYFQQLAYHLKEGRKTADLRTLLLNFNWLQAKLDATNITQLLADYQVFYSQKPVAESVEAEPPNAPEAEPVDVPMAESAEAPLKLIEGTLHLSSHVLARDKNQLAGQLRGRLLSFENEEIKSLCTKADEWRGGVWLSPMQPCLTPPGGPLIRTLSGHTSSVNAVAVVPDGRRAVSASDDGTLKIWNLGSEIEERTLEGHSASVQAVAITPDGQRVISASADRTLKVWNFATGAEELTLEGHSHWVTNVTVTLDGHLAISSSTYGTMKVWNLETGVEERTLDRHLAGVQAVAIMPDGRRAVSALDVGPLKIWNLASGEDERMLKGHSLRVYAVAITPDGQRAVSASSDGTLKIWNLANGEEERTLKGHSERVRAVVITPDGKRALSASEDGTLKIWNLASGEEEQTLKGHSDKVLSVAVTPHGKRAVSASEDGTLKIWDLSNSEEQKFMGHSGRVWMVAVTPDVKRTVSASEDGTLKIWNLASGEEERTLQGHSDWVRAVAITPDGKRAVSGSDDLTLKIWNLANGEEERTLRLNSRSSNDWVRAVAITPDGKRAISAMEDGGMKIFNLGSNQVKTLAWKYRVNAMAITHDGQRLVSSLFDFGKMEIWNLASGEKERTVLGHSSGVLSVALTPNGKRAISASADRMLKIWNLASGKEELTLAGHSSEVISVVMTSDGNHVVSASRDGTLKVWNIILGTETATLDLDHQPTSLAIGPDGALLTTDSPILVVGDRSGHVFWFALRTP